ncbi:hypothetical protein G7046_g5497 [Stylonectria norvegica]|nr:hypothetical protein G7046_g5497 [Stylonectria norvegica]
MNAERWRRRTLPSLETASTMPSQYDTPKKPEAMDTKKPRAFSKALRSLSNSSVESMSQAPARSSSSKRLQKTHSASSGSMIERIHRRVSNHSPISSSPPTELPASSMDLPYTSMEIVKYGPLRVDVSLLKARAEYLVLTDQCLVKLGSVEAARAVFTQLSEPHAPIRSNTSSGHLSSNKSAAAADLRLEIPLRSIVAVFCEEGSSPRFGIEVWWFSQWPRLAYSKTQLFFSLPKDRDDWLAEVQGACRLRLRGIPINSIIPDNLKARINHIVDTTESAVGDANFQNLTFPVAKRTVGLPQKGSTSSAEEAQNFVDGSSFYVVIGPCMCYFLEVLKAEHNTSPGELRVKAQSFGTVALTRFKASVASQEQRFVMSFRLPFARETRLELASTHYRRIIEAMTKVDRELKPMWPQHFQQAIFDIKGLPPPLQLTSGNDLGGLERSLKAYCAAFHVQVPKWAIEWNTPSQATFRLLPPDGPAYLPLQLLAVFRSLRYNSFFKALSFRGVDLSALAGRKDYSHYGDTVVQTSLNGQYITEEHHDLLVQAPILVQEIHALVFASESIRSIDLTSILGSRSSMTRQSRTQIDYEDLRKMSSEVLRPINLLLRQQLSYCHGLTLSGNPLASGDVEDLAKLLVLDHVCFKKLELASCGIGDSGLSKLWTGIYGQGATLQVLDTSENHGKVPFDVIRDSLSQLRALKKLNIAGNTRLNSDESLFDEVAINSWALEELDVSTITLNDATVDVLANYLSTVNSRHLKVLRLNHCELTGRQLARLFREMGQGRQMTVHINANRLDDGIEDLCQAISCGYGPWSLFVQMIEFALESNYIKLLRALTVNKTIECLSLAGSSTPDSASDTACQAVSEFFSKNNTIRFLDISGFDAKLDEGRLGRGFSKALSGLRTNTRIEHLRVRSQMLNVNIGDLAEAISGNKALHTLDCEGNEFNLSNFRHLVRHLEDNTSIRHFSAFSDRDLAQTIQKSVNSAVSAATPVRRQSVISRFRPEKQQSVSSRPLVQQLKDGWEEAVQKLQHLLERNQQIFLKEEEAQRASSPPALYRNTDGEEVFCKAFGGLALRTFEHQKARSNSTSNTPQQRYSSISLATSTTRLQGTIPEAGSRVRRSYSMVSSDDASSPATDSPSTGSAAPSPPELESPIDKEYSLGNQQHAADIRTEQEPADHDYNYADGQDGDFGLEIRMHRRFWSSQANAIEEEDGLVPVEERLDKKE